MEIFIDDVLVGDCGKALVYKSKGEQARERVFELINAVLDGDEVRVQGSKSYEQSNHIERIVKEVEITLGIMKNFGVEYILKSEEQAQQKQANIALAKQKREEAAKLIAEAEELEND